MLTLLLTVITSILAAPATHQVTYGSSIKLLHQPTNCRLHSHEIPYGQGSMLQSVTATIRPDDPSSLWLVKPAHGKYVKRGTPVQCGDIIRLEHIKTQKNLHSDHFESPVSKQQEVSCMGTKGIGNELDNWELICDRNRHRDGIWTRNRPIELLHVNTSKCLSARLSHAYGAPLQGHIEVAGSTNCTDADSKWRTAEGIYYPPPDQVED